MITRCGLLKAQSESGMSDANFEKILVPDNISKVIPFHNKKVLVFFQICLPGMNKNDLIHSILNKKEGLVKPNWTDLV